MSDSFKVNNYLVLLMALGLGVSLFLVPSSCTQEMSWSAVNGLIAARYPGVPHIETDSLARRLEEAAVPRPLLLDARTREEYAVSHLPDAVYAGPEGKAISTDSLSREAPIVVYCSVGYRSAGVVKRLEEAGFADVSNLKGSIFRWANEGRPLYRAGERVFQVHPYNERWGRLLDESLHDTKGSQPVSE